MLVMHHNDYLLICSTEWPSDCPYCLSLLLSPLSSHFNIKSILIAEFATCLQYDTSILPFQFVHLVAHVFEFSEIPFWAESFAVHGANCICLETEQHAEIQ